MKKIDESKFPSDFLLKNQSSFWDHLFFLNNYINTILDSLQKELLVLREPRIQWRTKWDFFQLVSLVLSSRCCVFLLRLLFTYFVASILSADPGTGLLLVLFLFSYIDSGFQYDVPQVKKSPGVNMGWYNMTISQMIGNNVKVRKLLLCLVWSVKCLNLFNSKLLTLSGIAIRWICQW